MTDRIPVKAKFTGADPTALAEFELGDTVPIAQGGTGAVNQFQALSNLGGIPKPGSSTDNAVVRWDGALGNVQDSAVSISDTGTVSGVERQLTANGTAALPSYSFTTAPASGLYVTLGNNFAATVDSTQTLLFTKTELQPKVTIANIDGDMTYPAYSFLLAQTTGMWHEMGILGFSVLSTPILQLSTNGIEAGIPGYEALVTFDNHIPNKRYVDDTIDNHALNTGNPHNVTAIQTGAIPTSEKGSANGVAELDAGSRIPIAQIPTAAISLFTVVADSAARLSLSPKEADEAKQLDDGSHWIYDGTAWHAYPQGGGSGHTHSNFAELELVTDGDHDVRIDNPHGVTKAQIGLGNVPDLDTTDAVNRAHDELHTVASHSDTTATGAELDELTGGGETSLHTHAGGGDVHGSEFAYGQDLPESSTTSGTDQTKVTVTLTGLPPGLYRIGWCCEVSATNNNGFVEVAATIDDVDMARLEYAPGGGYNSFAGFHYEILGSNHHIDIVYNKPSGPGSAVIRNAKLEFWRMS